jgi:hypothetical protein
MITSVLFAAPTWATVQQLDAAPRWPDRSLKQQQQHPPPPPALAPHVRSHGAPPTHRPIFAAAVSDRTLTHSFSGKLMACETKQVPMNLQLLMLYGLNL